MAITLAMIVKNEARTLARCLESAREAVDQIVAVDTGSTDGSQEIAKSFGGQVRQIEWRDDFAAARNESLEMVETEWVLWLDADEWLVEDAAEGIRAAVEREDAFGWLLLRRDLSESGAYSEQQLLRLWRHGEKLRFQGVIHEQIPLTAFAEEHPDKKLFGSNIAFWHDGYLGERTREKSKRNLAMLERALSEDSSSLYLRIELAQTLRNLGEEGWRDEEARIEDLLLSHSDLDEPPDNTTALYFMRRFADLSPEDPNADRLLRMARGWHPDHPGVRFMSAQIEVKRSNLRQALDDLLAVEHMAETGKYDRLTASNPTMLGEGLSLNLALVAHQLGRKGLARKHYLRLMELHPGHPVAVENLRMLR